MKYVEYGYSESIDIQLARDGELLRSLEFSLDQLAEWNDDVLKAFIAAGGDDSHSGASWSAVREIAYKLTKHGWKTLDDIPEDHFLYSGLKEA